MLMIAVLVKLREEPDSDEGAKGFLESLLDIAAKVSL